MEETQKSSNINDPTNERKYSEYDQIRVPKKRRTKKLNTILKKSSKYINQSKQEKMSIKWDNEKIESQNANKKKNKLSISEADEMKRQSSTRYKHYTLGGEEDEYLKYLIKVNEIKVTDDIIKNIMKRFNEPHEHKKTRTFSTHVIRGFNSSPSLLQTKDDIKVFEGSLDDESKITLENTIINKFHKELIGIGSGDDFHSAKELKII